LLAIKAHDAVHLIATRGQLQLQHHIARGYAAGIAGTCECRVQGHPEYTGCQRRMVRWAWLRCAFCSLFLSVFMCAR
jgi:hypothetical protein